jgi:hypothetical protein
MINRSIGFIILGMALIDPASARMTYTYITSGYCSDLRHVVNVRRCATNQTGHSCRPDERHMCPPGTCSKIGTRDACYLKNCAAENCRH